MAIPQYIAKSAFASGTAALTVGAVAGAVNGDLILLFVESANQAITTPTGYTQVTNSPQSTGTAAAAGGVRLTVFYRFATGADTTTSVADSGDHTTAIKVLIRGVDTTAPFNTTAGSVQASAATAWTLPAVTTTLANCLIVYGIANDRDIASTTNITAFTNANLTGISKVHDQTVTSGVGGGLAIYEGDKATAGSTGTASATNAASNTAAFLTIALNELVLPARTGSLSATESAVDSFSAAGDVFVKGTLSSTESASDSFSASGTVTDPAITGSLSVSETGSDVFSASAQLIVTGSLAATETGIDSFSGTAQLIVSGSLSSTESGIDTFAASGAAVIIGSMIITEVGDDVFSATGSVYSISTGSLDATEESDALSSSGNVFVLGSLSVTETDLDSFVATGYEIIISAGSLSVTELSDGIGGYVTDGYVVSGYTITGWTGFPFRQYPLPSEVAAGIHYGLNGEYIGTAISGGGGNAILMRRR